MVKSDYRYSYNLGSHNVLLEATYDLWAEIGISGLLPTLYEPTGSHTKNRLKTVMGCTSPMKLSD